jgi:hypothetical protein
VNENNQDETYAPIIAAISHHEEILFLYLVKNRIKSNELISKIINYPQINSKHIDWIEKLISEKKYI